MDKKHLFSQVASNTGLPQDTVESVLNSLEDVIVEQLRHGEQVHWGGFIRAWTVLKRPTIPSGKYAYTDGSGRKIRYLSPMCRFGATVVQRMKKEQFNAADKQWKTRPAVTCPEDAQDTTDDV